jgi:hypothetical protein
MSMATFWFFWKHCPDSTIQLGTSIIKRLSHLFWSRTGFVSLNYPIILHSLSHLILNITWIRWFTAFLQLLNFVCLLEFGYFTAFSLRASFWATIFVFAKVFEKTFVTFWPYTPLHFLTSNFIISNYKGSISAVFKFSL